MLFRKLVKNVFYLGSRNVPNFSVSAQRYARFGKWEKDGAARDRAGFGDAFAAVRAALRIVLMRREQSASSSLAH